MPALEAPLYELGAGVQVLEGVLALEGCGGGDEVVCSGEEGWEVREGVEEGVNGRFWVGLPGGGCPVGG